MPEEHIISVLPNTIDSNANVLVVQYVVRLPFTIDIVLHPSTISSSPLSSAALLDTTDYMTAVHERSVTFQKRFDETFQLTAHGYNRKQIAFAQSSLANLLGGKHFILRC